jgi:hypothetical protein
MDQPTALQTEAPSNAPETITPSLGSAPVPSQPPPPVKKPFSRLLFTVLILLVVGVLVGGGYFLGAQKNNTAPSPSPTTASPTASQTATTATPSPSDSGIPITEKTVSFTRVNGEVYMRYKGRIYNEEAANKNDPSLTKLTNPDSYTWYGLVDAPQIKEELSGFDELFDFKTLPDKNNFIFIMRWPTSGLDTAFNVFSYDAYQQGAKVEKIYAKSKDAKQEEYFIPRIKQISPDGKYIAFNLYVCWNCGGVYPQTMLFNLSTKATKRIGKTSVFNWKSNGAYEYKEYKVIPCDPPLEGPGECSEDPANLPLQTNTF